MNTGRSEAKKAFERYMKNAERYRRHFTEEERAAVARLVPYAREKLFVLQLLVNGYNSNLCPGVNVGVLMRYAAGEGPDSTYHEDIISFLNVISRGVETHELIGDDAIRELVSSWKEYQAGCEEG